MKKRIATAAVIIALLAVMLLPWAMSHVSGQTVALLDCLPQGQWLEFTGEQTVSGQVQPLDMTNDTSEEVRNAFEQCYIRQGDYPAAGGENSFRYQFKTEDGQACEIQVWEGGCVLITLDGLTTAYYDANHSIDVYWNLDVRFGSDENI